MDGNDTALIPGNDTPPLAGQRQRIAGHERGQRTTAPRVIQAAGRTQAFAPGGARGKMRAADADRDGVVECLNLAYSQGRLSKDEYAGRLDDAFAARTYADLDQLVIDLPPAAAAPVTAATPAAPVAKINELALASLACGLAQFMVGPVAAIPAIVFGHAARHQIRRSGEHGAGLALAGLILGWAVVILTIVLILGLAMSAGVHGTAVPQ
jgi:Domain of unknown function (DUF4190)/Domain of unknown function (DUF1707)